MNKQTIAKPINARLNKGQSDKLLADVSEIAPHLLKLLPIYLQAIPERREELLAHSPVLAAFVALLEECGVALPISQGIPGE